MLFPSREAAAAAGMRFVIESGSTSHGRLPDQFAPNEKQAKALRRELRAQGLRAAYWEMFSDGVLVESHEGLRRRRLAQQNGE